MLRADQRTMADDETEIKKAYWQGHTQAVLMGAAVLGASYFGEKIAFAAAALVVIYLLNDIIDRLYDLTIRLSRTNELLVDGHNERRWRKETQQS
jgi:hypothetical protein